MEFKLKNSSHLFDVVTVEIWSTVLPLTEQNENPAGGPKLNVLPSWDIVKMRSILSTQLSVLPVRLVTECLQCTLGAAGSAMRRPTHGLRHFRPFTMECNFVPCRRNNLRDRLPLCLPVPGTSKRNKDLRRCCDAGMYAAWTPVHRGSGNDSV